MTEVVRGSEICPSWAPALYVSISWVYALVAWSLDVEYLAVWRVFGTLACRRVVRKRFLRPAFADQFMNGRHC
jgi:hypothetical protein